MSVRTRHELSVGHLKPPLRIKLEMRSYCRSSSKLLPVLIEQAIVPALSHLAHDPRRDHGFADYSAFVRMNALQEVLVFRRFFLPFGTAHDFEFPFREIASHCHSGNGDGPKNFLCHNSRFNYVGIGGGFGRGVRPSVTYLGGGMFISYVYLCISR